MKELSALIILLSSTAICPAEDLTVDGVTYKDFRWGTVTPYEVGVIYSGGITSVPLEKLPPELQKRFGYDPQRAAAYRQAGVEQAAYQQETMGKVWFEGKIVFRGTLDYARITGWVDDFGLYSIRTGLMVTRKQTTYAPGSVDTTVQKTHPTVTHSHTTYAPGDVTTTVVSGEDADTFEGTIVDLGHDVESVLGYVPQGRGSVPAYVPGRHVQGGQRVIIKNRLDASMHQQVDFYAVPIGHLAGMEAYAIATPISFEDWKRFRTDILAVHH